MNMAPAAWGKSLAAAPYGMLIGEDWVPAQSGQEMPVIDPGTGEIHRYVPDGGKADMALALDAAHHAQHTWSLTTSRARGEILDRAYAIMIARLEELALLVTLENGKPLSEARGEIAYAAEFFRWFSEEAVRIYGRYMAAPLASPDSS